MTLLRRALALAASAALIFALTTGDAHAKKNKKKDEPTIELTGIAAFDDVFTRVKEIDQRLTDAEALLKTGKQDLNAALGLKRGAPFKDGIADLKAKADGKLAIAMKGKQPKLEATDAVPQNVTDAIDAVNRLTDGIVGTVDSLAGIPDEASKLVKQTKKFPNKLKDELQADPITTLLKAPKVSKTLKGNAEVTAGLPNRSEKVVSRMNGMVNVVRDEFPIRDGEGGKADDGKADEPAEKTPSGGSGRRTGR